MMEQYFNQSIVWKSKTGVNDDNESTFAADATIDARFEYKRRMVRNKEGKEVLSEAWACTSRDVKPDDVIVYDGIDWIVIAAAPQPSLFGEIMFYEVWM